MMLISEAFERYRVDCIVFKNQSPKTEESHKYALKLILKYIGDIEIESLTFEQVRVWKTQLDKGRCQSTVREYIIRLRVVLRYMQLIKVDTLNYQIIGVPRRQERVPEFLSKDQVAELIEAISQRQRGYSNLNRLRNMAVVSLLYASGIRAAEICRLNRSDIREDGTFTVFGKGNKTRLCFIDQRTKDYLFDYLRTRQDNNLALFISDQTGKRMTKSTLQRIFESARRKVDFDIAVHAHVMRHSFATNLLRNNTNMRYVQEMLGHSSLVTTQMYTHVVNEDLHKVYQTSHTF